MRHLAASAIAAILVSSGANAQTMVDATRPEALLAIAETFGAAGLDTDSYGDPVIVGLMGGTNYFVEFYGCENGRNCTELLFRAGFTTPDLTEREMAEWNRNAPFGKVYIDAEGAPHIEMDVILTGGVSEANMIDNFDLWGQTLAEFVRYIGWDQ